MARSDATTDGDADAETVADVYDALAPIYDAMGGGQPFAMLVAERLEELIAASPPRRRVERRSFDAVSFLDLGCGTGTLLLALRARHPGWRLCGVDVSPGMLAVAAQQARARKRALGARAAAGPASVHRALRPRRRVLRHAQPPPRSRRAGGDLSDRRLRAASRGPVRVRSEQRVRVRDLVAVSGRRSMSRGATSTPSSTTTPGPGRRARRWISRAAGANGGSCSRSAVSPSPRSKGRCWPPGWSRRSRPPGARSTRTARAKRGLWRQRDAESPEQRHEHRVKEIKSTRKIVVIVWKQLDGRAKPTYLWTSHL